jgi:tape measure domain-containing protein
MANSLNYTLNLKDLFSKGMSNAVNQTDKLDKKMSSLGNKQNALSSGASRLGGVIAGAFSVGAVLNFGQAVYESLKNYEMFHASLKTMLHGNENATKALEGQLVNLAKTTPFELTQVQNATKQLLAYGFKAGDVVDTMRTLGDVSAGVGAPLEDIAYLYGTLKTSGRVMQVDLRQFAGRGIPIYETLAKRLGVTTTKVNEMVSAGKIGFKDIENAFKDMTAEGGQFFNLMEDQSKTVGGKVSNLGDAWEQIKVQIGLSQSGIIASTLDFVSNFASSLGLLLTTKNSVEKSLKESGLKESWWDKLSGNKEGLPSMVNNLEGYQMKLDAINDSKMSAGLKLMAIEKERQKLQKQADFGDIAEGGAISTKDYLNKLALIKGALGKAKGNVDLAKQTAKTSDLASGKDKSQASTKLGTGTEVTGARPQNLTININELVHELKLMSTNVTEGAMKIKEEIAKALMEAVNDVNLIAR